MKNPPILIAVLGFFAALAGFGNLFFGLRVLGFDWFGVLGDIPAFDGVGLWGWLAVVTGLIWILVALGLWGLQPWARVFALIVTGFALFEAVLAFFQLPGTGVGFAMAIMPGLLFWYLNTREVKAAFGVGEPAAPAVAAAPVAAAAPAPMAAPAPAPVAAAVVVAPAAAVVAQPAAEESVEAPVAAAAPMAAAPMAAASDEPAPAVDRMPIEDVEGIGPASGERLAAAGIKTTDDLLAAGARPYDRERIAEATGISSERIREWVDKIDLMRVPGVGPQYSDLLVAAGVGSPAELARRNAANLEVTFQEVVAARPGIVRRVPGEAEISDWIEAAGTLEQVVEH
jgi:predicted flap endonuclease-1-like 5' DNA nuclease